MLFQAFIIGFITNGGGGTLTSLYQSGCSQTRYWSFTKFLSRGKWDADAVAALMMKLLQQAKEIWVYVYDETIAIKTGKSHWGLHFFRNFSFYRRRINQSKYQFGHRKSINRFVQLSFVAACLTKLVFIVDLQIEKVKVEDVCKDLGIHWYRPERLTLGLCVAVLRLRITQTLFSVSSKQKRTHRILHSVFGKSMIYIVIKLLGSTILSKL